MKTNAVYKKPISARRPFAVDTVGTLGSTVFTTLLHIPISILIARFLGPDGKGIMTIVWLILGQLALFLSLGVEIALIHYAGKRQWSINRLASVSMGLGFLLGILGFAIAIAIFGFAFQTVLPKSLFPLLVLMSSTLPIVLTIGFLKSLLRTAGHIVEDSALSVLQAVLSLVAISVALLTGFGITSVLIASWLSSLLSSLITIVFLIHWQIVQKPPVFEPSINKVLVTYGIKSHVGSIFQSLNYRFDIYLVVFFLGTASVGYYSIAVGMAEWLWILPGVLGPVLMQRVATRTTEDTNQLMGILNRITSVILFVGVVVWAIISNLFIRILYGDTFTPSYVPLLLLLPGVWALGLWKNFLNDLSVRGYPHIKSYTAGIAFVMTIVLDFIFIPLLGIAGAALASSIAYISAFLSGLWFYCKITHYRPLDLLVPKQGDFRIVIAKIKGLIPYFRAV